MKVSKFHILKKCRFFLLLCIAALVISGCGGSGSTSDSADTSDDSTSGTLAVSLTDAEGDFASYTLDVLSLTLTRANGTQVSALPLSSRIDFAQYTDMTEFLTIATIPSGVYTAATMVLDYADADVWVENAAGELVQATDIVDQDGQAVSQLTVSVQLEGRSRLVIAPGVPMHLTLDFDLRATNQTVFDSQGVPTVTVDPYLVADVNLNNHKIHRLRGLLDEVDTDSSEFSLHVRPFYCALSGNHHEFGTMTVLTDADTLFEVDGVAGQGAAGLTAMATLDAMSAVVVIGDLEFNPLRFEARQVYAGTSVPWNNLDTVSGSVVARSGNQLTIKGVTLQLTDGQVTFQDLVTVQLGDETLVTRQLSLTQYTTDDLSVGQHVSVSGAFNDDDPANPVLDATQGYVRLKMTSVRGTVLDVTPADATAQLSMDLRAINLHPVDIFDFAGTGADAASDADPSDYEINTADLNLSGLTAGDPVNVRGFVQPFGMAPQDFNAESVFNIADARAVLKVKWQPATESAFESIATDGLTLNMDGATLPCLVIRYCLLTDLTDLAQSPVIVPDPDNSNLFVLRNRNTFDIFLDFESYVSALQDDLDAGQLVHKVWAVGTYDDTSGVFTADVLDINLR